MHLQEAFKQLAETKQRLRGGGIEDAALDATVNHCIANYIGNAKVPLPVRWLISRERIRTEHKGCMDYIVQGLGGQPGDSLESTTNALHKTTAAMRDEGRDPARIDEQINKLFFSYLQRYPRFIRKRIVPYYTDCMQQASRELEAKYL